MSVVASRDDKKLLLEIDEEDLEALDKAIEKWNLKDIQSYWRFCVSVLIEAEKNGLWIESNGIPVKIIPAKHSLKDANPLSV